MYQVMGDVIRSLQDLPILYRALRILRNISQANFENVFIAFSKHAIVTLETITISS